MEDNAVKVFESLWQQFTHAPSHTLLLGVLIVFGILIKKSPTPNWTIPWLLIFVGAMGYPFLASPANINPTFPRPDLVLRIYGGGLGVGAIVAHNLLRRFAWFRSFEYSIVNAFRDEDEKVAVPQQQPKKDETP